EHELDDRNRWAALYTELLSGAVKTPIVPEGYTSSWAQYTIWLNDRAQRDSVQAALKEQGIPSMIYYVKPLHLQTAYNSLGYKPGSLPVSEAASERVLSLPMHPYLDEATVRKVAEAVLAAVK
ncbi:MAG: aminotransferase DegT, partial [Ruminococcaceae bacterium]|nr:aminotransferase DegT [Oscillospiraceae bacterium]